MDQRSGMVDSVDDVKIIALNSRFFHFPNFEILDARIASALNKIIQNSNFKKVSLEEQKAQKNRFLRWRQTAYMIFDYFRVTGAHDTVLDYAALFSITLLNDDVQEFDTRWDEILLSVTKIPIDDFLENLYKSRIRATQNRIKMFWPWNPLEDIGSWLSKNWKRLWREA